MIWRPNKAGKKTQKIEDRHAAGNGCLLAVQESNSSQATFLWGGAYRIASWQTSNALASDP